MSRSFFPGVVLVTGCLLLTAAAQQSPSAGAQSTPAQPTAVPSSQQQTAMLTQPKDLVIGSGDLLETNVYGAPEYHYEVRVSSAGTISLPMLGAVHVAGMTVAQAEEAIGNQLRDKKIFTEPQVFVFAKEYATQGISVLGEVQKPGIYPLLGAHTLLDAISAAGGVTPKAGDAAIITHRDRPNQSERVKLAHKLEETPNNVPVSPGDTIVVSKAGVVYVIGDVKEPAGIVMETPNFTVLQVLAMAHGPNPTAKLSQAKLIRKTPSGEQQEIPLPLNKILSSKSPDLPLQAGDILYVPSSTAKSATRRGLQAILEAATGVAIYRR
jgi:polysaccharide export outer membrane protein